MTLNKTTKIDKIEVVESGHVQIRERTDIIEDGNVISSTYHRRVLSPGDDTSKEPANVKGIAQATWTAEVVKKYQDSLKQ